MDAITPLDRLYFTLRIRQEVLERRGEAFQQLFASVMEIAHPGDFVPVAPWGASGDLKNDGYLASERTIFQCYAPHELGAAKTIAKIDEDYAGAVKHWGGRFDRWVLVHNVSNGVPAPVLAKLTELGTPSKKASGTKPSAKDAKAPEVGSWGPGELERRLFHAKRADLVRLLGEPFDEAALAEVGFLELRTILDHIAQQAEPIDADLRPVSPAKLTANALTPEAAAFLRVGMRKSALVGRFFRTFHDPALGDRVAETFRNEYGRLKGEGKTPDEILMRLWMFAKGVVVRSPRIEAAGLAVIAYLFEQCDIFEAPAAKDAQ